MFMKNIKRTSQLALAGFTFLIYGCNMNSREQFATDPHSYAKPNAVFIKHIDLDLSVDFGAKKLSGWANLTIVNQTDSDKLLLDSHDLSVTKVTLDENESETHFALGSKDPVLGQPLSIDVKPGTKSVKIYYHTSPEAAALQWLTPEQTSSGEHPFLFTQSEAILARTWIPCQDSPGIRITYSATIRTTSDLMAVMSAENGTEKTADGVYHFEMPQPIPSYLLALAVGDLRFRALGPRSGVYAEPSVIDRAAFELEDTEDMITAAEQLYGPYRWQRYDVIILPPSFPFGGMENPRLTFATPTILAGDKSLVALVAHELAHSWSGNLVTNATWNDFWLNEGFTTYFEHRIMESLYGADYAEMLASLSFQDLQSDLDEIGPERPADTHLHLDLAGRNPDDGMTAVAYDKGHFFLRSLEKLVGREKWDKFLRGYFDKFAFTPMTSDKFVAYLREQLINTKDLEERAQIDAWVYGPGLPSGVEPVKSSEFTKVETQIKAWQDGTPAAHLKTDGWTTHHWLHFLMHLPEKMSRAQMAKLDEAFQFTQSGNSEILSAWFVHVITSQYQPAYPAMENFLTSMGRRKFLKPLYQKMAENPAMLEMAKLIYAKARPTYHSVSTGTIDALLHWQS